MLDRRLFLNAVEELDTRPTHESCVVLNLSPHSLRRKTNKPNALYGDTPAEPLREWNRQP